MSFAHFAQKWFLPMKGAINFDRENGDVIDWPSTNISFLLYKGRRDHEGEKDYSEASAE